MSEAKIILITGGGRSGKSTYAQRLAESLPGPRAYIATATAFDGELEERIARHRGARRDEHWSETIEEPLALARAIRDAAGYRTLLVDCLTMWVGNLMWAAAQAGGSRPAAAPETRAARGDADRMPPGSAAPTEAEVAAACQDIVSACRQHEGTVVLVTNEVGLGVIPDNDAARLYRDLLGRCNQVMAAAAETVILMVSGLPLTLKTTGRAPRGPRP